MVLLCFIKEKAFWFLLYWDLGIRKFASLKKKKKKREEKKEKMMEWESEILSFFF